MRRLGDQEPAPGARVRLHPSVKVKASLSLERPEDPNRPVPSLHGPYWDDPVGRAGEVRPEFDVPTRCHRFYFTEPGRGERDVKFIDSEHKGLALHDQLRSWQPYGQIKEHTTPQQRHLLLHLALANMLEVDDPARQPR